MMLHNGCNYRQGQLCGILSVLVVAILWLLPSQPVLAQSDPIPEVIKKIDMGATAAAVLERMQAMGTHTTEELPKEHRSRLVWDSPGSPYYKAISFQFTEKDRLYLIKFSLNDAARTDYPALKRTIFKDYDFSWERPIKLNVKDQDIVMYGPEKGLSLYFFEFTDRKTHEKSFELFDRSVSSTDRVYTKAKEKTEGTEPKPQEETSSDPRTKEDKDQSQTEQGTGAASPPAVSSDQRQDVTPKPAPAQEALPERKPEK